MGGRGGGHTTRCKGRGRGDGFPLPEGVDGSFTFGLACWGRGCGVGVGCVRAGQGLGVRVCGVGYVRAGQGLGVRLCGVG